jgi:Ca-activated chloride channel homolog
MTATPFCAQHAVLRMAKSTNRFRRFRDRVKHSFPPVDNIATIMPMWQRAFAFFILAIIVATQVVRPASQSSGSADISVSVNLVKVPLSVFDAKGNLVSHLQDEDFRIWEDRAAQEIRSFGLDTNPVSVVLLMDTSGTEKPELNRIKEAAEGFVDALASGDRVSIITFNDQVYLNLDWTDDLKKVRKTLKKVRPGLLTALYDAMYLAASEQLKGVDGRKAIILLTDCLNHESLVGWKEASLSIVQSQASLYVVSKTIMVREQAKREHRVVMLNDIYKKLFGDGNYVDEYFSKLEKEMTDLSEKTGGRCFFPSDYNQIKDIYSEVARELKSKYFLTYISNQNLTPNSYHGISIEYLKPSSKMNYRKGYYFKPEMSPKSPLGVEFGNLNLK